MKKKEYIIPTMTIVQIKRRNCLLLVSGEKTEGAKKELINEEVDYGV